MKLRNDPLRSALMLAHERQAGLGHPSAPLGLSEQGRYDAREPALIGCLQRSASVQRETRRLFEVEGVRAD